jgi:hypothetical protein
MAPGIRIGRRIRRRPAPREPSGTAGFGVSRGAGARILCLETGEPDMTMRRGLAIGMAAAMAAGAAAAGPVREYEIKLDEKPVSGKQVVSVRFTPGETRNYDQVVFDCVLRQEYMQTDSSGRQRKRVVEPATFTFRENGIRFVEALDKHISFWVPVGVEQLKESFGDTLFVGSAPVTIHKITIRAMVGGEAAWTLENQPGTGPQKPPESAGAPGEDSPRDKYGLPVFKGGARK